MSRYRWLLVAGAAGVATLLVACNVAPPAIPPPTARPAPAPAPVPEPIAPPAVLPEEAPAPAAASPPVVVRPGPSNATNAKAYRRDAASHLYALNAHRIYKGKLQPLLYAVGVLDVDIDRQGQITAINWRRAPSHVPEVMAEILRTVRAAAPYPVPARLGRVTYTEIWLWDKSGKFQLDTLTEGQL